MTISEGDKHLTRAAAKATGQDVEYDESSGFFFVDTKYSCLTWGPLYRDTDAFQLLVKLNLSVDAPKDKNWYVVTDQNGNFTYSDPELFLEDKAAALRRAITLAAAKMA